MKKPFLAFLLIGMISLAYAQDQTLDKKYRPVVTNFVNAVKSGNIDKLSSKIKYPLNRTYPIPPIKNKQEFVKRYKEVFDDNLTKKIINAKVATD